MQSRVGHADLLECLYLFERETHALAHLQPHNFESIGIEVVSRLARDLYLKNEGC